MGMNMDIDMGSIVVADLLCTQNSRRQGTRRTCIQKAGRVPFEEGTPPAS